MWAALGLLVFAVMPLRAAVIIDRAALNSIVGSLAVAVNFEAYNLAAGQATGVNANFLNSLTTLTVASDIQGPNLVPAGVSFSGTTLQWNDKNYFGAPSREILATQNTLTITFSSPTTAFGLDVRNFQGYSSTMTVTVFGADGTTTIFTAANFALSGTPIFFGYADTNGILRVTLSNSGSPWSPIIDNLTFAAIPEPTTWMLLATGLSAVAISAKRRVGRYRHS
jgi:hypothetical protein